MELRPIERTDRGRRRLNAALGIYRQTILPEAQNPETQILYWIEHGRDALADEFRCFALLSGRVVVGYLQYSYFREEHLFFFEYLCIRDRRHRGLVPHDALRAIEDMLAQTYSPGFAIVFEVAHTRDATPGTWRADEKLVAYFKRLGFRRVDFPYRYPVLQSYEGDVSYPADLMVRLPDGRTVLTALDMRTILRCVYFKHYLRWDRPFLEPAKLAERERLINALYVQQIEAIGSDDQFGTTGDARRSRTARFTNTLPRISTLLDRLFGPKLPRLVVVIGVLLVARNQLGSIWLLIPFVLIVSAIYCLAEDTDASRKLFLVILSRFKFARLRRS